MQIRFPGVSISVNPDAVFSENAGLIVGCFVLLIQAERDVSKANEALEKVREAHLRTPLGLAGGAESKEVAGALEQVKLAKEEERKIQQLVEENLIKYLKEEKIDDKTLQELGIDIPLVEFAIRANMQRVVSYFHQQKQLPDFTAPCINTIEMAKQFYAYGYEMSDCLPSFALRNTLEAVQELILTCGANINHRFRNKLGKCTTVMEAFCEDTKMQILSSPQTLSDAWKKERLEILEFFIAKKARFPYGKPMPQDWLDFLRAGLKPGRVDPRNLPKLIENKQENEEKIEEIAKKPIPSSVIKDFLLQIYETLKKEHDEFKKAKLTNRQEEIQAVRAKLAATRKFIAEKLRWWFDNDYIQFDTQMPFHYANEESLTFGVFALQENFYEVIRQPKFKAFLNYEFRKFIRDMEMVKIFYDAGIDIVCQFVLDVIIVKNDPLLTRELVETYGLNVNLLVGDQDRQILLLNSVMDDTKRKLQSDEKLTDEWKENRREIIMLLVNNGARAVLEWPVTPDFICKKLATKEPKEEIPLPPVVYHIDPRLTGGFSLNWRRI